jgi:hypothetical protein
LAPDATLARAAPSAAPHCEQQRPLDPQAAEGIIIPEDFDNKKRSPQDSAN